MCCKCSHLRRAQEKKNDRPTDRLKRHKSYDDFYKKNTNYFAHHFNQFTSFNVIKNENVACFFVKKDGSGSGNENKMSVVKWKLFSVPLL